MTCIFKNINERCFVLSCLWIACYCVGQGSDSYWFIWKGYGKTNWSFVQEMVKQLARVWSSTFFNLEYEFIPLFDSWAKITSAIMTIITKKVTLHFFNPSVTVFGAEKCFAYFFTRNKTYDFAKTITYVVTQNYWKRERIQILSCLWYCSIASLTNRKYLYNSERIPVQWDHFYT